jgi:hypothetical protein
LLPALCVWVAPSLADLGQFAICGALGVVAHTMLAHAFARIEAAKLAPIGYVTLVWGVSVRLPIFCRAAWLGDRRRCCADRGRNVDHTEAMNPANQAMTQRRRQLWRRQDSQAGVLNQRPPTASHREI